MTSLFVDPWMLAFVDGENGDDYVQRLIDIYEIAISPAVSVEITAHAADLLEKDGAYPISKEFPAAVWPRREDVYRAVARIIDRVPKIEDQSISATLSSNVSVIPDIIVAQAHRDYLYELFALVSLRKSYGQCSSACVLTAALASSIEIEVTANIEIIESTVNIEHFIGEIVRSSISLRYRVVDFLKDCSPLQIARAGNLKESISLAIWQSNPVASEDVWRANGWSIGREFAKSIIDCGLSTNDGRFDSMLRTIVSLINGVGLRATHHLRAGAGPNEKQVVRVSDGAKAWRADIDDELHLHYWVISGGVELANVVFHKNIKIVK